MAAGLLEPQYGTDGAFVWITFKRPNSVTDSVTNSVTNLDTSLDTGLDTNLDTSLDTTQELSDNQKEVVYNIIAKSSRKILVNIDVINHSKNRDSSSTTLLTPDILISFI